MSFKLVFIVFRLALLCFLKKIRCIHAWCTPGGAIGYFVSLLSGRPLILDSFEPHAETMVESTTWKQNSLAYKILFRLEKLQLKRATEVICAAEGMVRHSQKIYGIRKTRYFTKPACVDLNLFQPNVPTGNLKAQLGLKDQACVYAGKFGGIYLTSEVFDFFKVAWDYWQGNFSVLLLTSHSDEEIMVFCKKAGLPNSCIVKKYVPHNEVPRFMSLGTFGICPVKPLPSKAFCTPIKNGEYWAMGLPVVITKNISSDSQLIADNDIGYVLNDLNKEEYLAAIRKIEQLGRNPNIRQSIRQLAEQNRNFEQSELIYKTIYGQNSAYSKNR
jgi:glycosyltransferase involved in cell wall biosynthesis